MDTTINRRAGDIVVTFYVDGIAKLVIICRIAITKVNAFGNVGCIIGNVLVGLEQLPAINGLFATIGNVPICHIADTFIAHIDTTIIQYRPAIIYSEFVRGEIRIGGNGNFLAGMGNGNVRAVFEIHGIARRDIGRAAAIGLHIPAFVGGSFYRLDGIMHGIFAGIANIAHGDIAAVIHRRIAAQDVFAAFADIADGILRPVKLAAVDGIGGSVIDASGGDVGDGALFARVANADGRDGCSPRKAGIDEGAHRRGIRTNGGGGFCATTQSNGIVISRDSAITKCQCLAGRSLRGLAESTSAVSLGNGAMANGDRSICLSFAVITISRGACTRCAAICARCRRRIFAGLRTITNGNTGFAQRFGCLPACKGILAEGIGRLTNRRRVGTTTLGI